jgi:hypothetical protein
MKRKIQLNIPFLIELRKVASQITKSEEVQDLRKLIIFSLLAVAFRIPKCVFNPDLLQEKLANLQLGVRSKRTKI